MKTPLSRIDPTSLGFDFDGVIADTAETFIRLACEKYQYCDVMQEDIISFEVEECLDIAPDIVESIFTEVLLDSVGTGLQPMPGALEVLGELTEHSAVTVITARPKADPVHAWLEKMLPLSACSNIRVIAMGDHDDKARHIREQGLTHFIDDRADTCNYLNSVGINSIVFSRPWNKNRHNLPLVNNWQDIRALCLPDKNER
jgi:5'(3')-deoxyribonucleotidase